MKKALTFVIMLIMVLIAVTGCQNVSRDRAIEITQEFVNNNVKFSVTENNSAHIAQKAQITILGIDKKENDWQIFLNVKSNSTGELKQANLYFIIDGKKEEIKDWGRLEK